MGDRFWCSWVGRHQDAGLCLLNPSLRDPDYYFPTYTHRVKGPNDKNNVNDDHDDEYDDYDDATMTATIPVV